MRAENPSNRQEKLNITSIERPAVESFSDNAIASEVWPENVCTNGDFQEQIEARKTLNESLNNVFNQLPRPDISIQDAIRQGLVTEEQIEKTYSSLTHLLGSTQDYNRIVLYLPFEFLPNKNWQPATEKLQQSSEQFRNKYMEAWRSLLTMYDVRANFVDGDILESEHRQGDFPRVVKAAHLLPKLVEKGFISAEEVISLMENSDDPMLKNSIADTLPVLMDMHFITEDQIRLMENSKDGLTRSMAKILVSEKAKPEAKPEKTPVPPTLSSVQNGLTEKFAEIDEQKFGKITKKRGNWLKQTQKQKAIELFEDSISSAIVSDTFTDESSTEFISQEANPASQQALIGGIRKAVESLAQDNPQDAQDLYKKYQGELLTLWNSENPEVKEALTKTFYRLNKLGIVGEQQLSELGINSPKLEGPFSENLKSMETELQEVKNAIATIEADPKLSQLLYPVALVFGSRLKGYGLPGADIDVGVFIKPEVSAKEKTELKELLEKVFSHEKINGEVVEFWLQQKGNDLEIKNTAKENSSTGESHWAHILFGASWQGNENAIRELKEKLLAPYMLDTKKEIHGQSARAVYLGEMERDALQYRLMHKGYQRFFPQYGGINTPHSDDIDGNSMFWDSGYRQLATKIFASKVFLPKIPT